MRPRLVKGTPIASYSSLSQPTPTVVWARPPLSQSSVAICFAATIGLCSGRIVTIDPMVIVEVAPATNA